MLLCLDAGNTRLKWGLRDGEFWRGLGVLDYGGLDAPPAAWGQATRAVLANVAGEPVGRRLETLCHRRGLPLHTVVARAAAAGVVNGYREPARLGPDRWAALAGARALQVGACLVVCAGTATTVDVLLADGRFEGGIILPGVDMMRRALAGNTARLPLVEKVAFVPCPASTEEAIQAGCLHAQAGAVERMFRLVAGQAGAVCLVAGGARRELLPLLSVPAREAEHLVLEGLVRLADAPA